ncbi:MAG: acetate--CoA ligase family protein [Methanotrichaceae archaeon]
MTELFKEIIDQTQKEDRTYLMEHECKELLERLEISTTGALVTKSEDEAVQISESIGYPVVLKVLSPEVIHKSDAGGVKLNLNDADDVRRAYSEILNSFKNKNVIGITVQKMAPQGLEAIVGMTRDPTFGPVLMFGLGGIFVEVLKDVSFRVLPVTKKDVNEMMTEIKGHALLQGYRGTSVDLSALEDLLLKISDMVMNYPQIKELDLNPVFLYPSGNVVADARIFLEKTETQDTPVTDGDLRDLFYPKNIAVLGASDKPGKLGWNVFSNLLNHNFGGQLYPVNLKAKTVQGVPAVSSIGNIEGTVDVAIVLVPAAAAPKAVKECCQKGVKFVIIESAGFAEIGADGKSIETKIKKIAEEHDCRVLGPNCSGIINTYHNMVQSIGVVDDLRPGNIGLIAQAGVYAAGMLWGLRHTLDFGIVATIGNKLDINETDVLEFFGKDENVKVVCMYLEDVKHGRRFIDVAKEVTKKKPVIALKSGQTDAGKKAISSHTASLAGNDLIYDAAFRQAGIIRARDNYHMFGLAKAFSKQPVPPNDGILVISYAGSLGVATTDALYMNGMKLAELDPESNQRLKEILPKYVGCHNPVDYTFDMDAEQVKKTIEIGVNCDDVGGFIVVLQAETLDSYIDELKKIDYQGKPILSCVACKEFVMDDVIKMEQAGIPVYSTPEEAAEVLSVMYKFKETQQKTLTL